MALDAHPFHGLTTAHACAQHKPRMQACGMCLTLGSGGHSGSLGLLLAAAGAQASGCAPAM